MFAKLKAKIREAWDFSRTIFLNVASVALLGADSLFAYLVGVDWASVIHNPKLLLAVTIGINVANIYLRTQTTAAVGKKPKEGDV